MVAGLDPEEDKCRLVSCLPDMRVSKSLQALQATGGCSLLAKGMGLLLPVWRVQGNLRIQDSQNHLPKCLYSWFQDLTVFNQGPNSGYPKRLCLHSPLHLCSRK